MQMAKTYRGRKLDNVSYPMGGFGAGMVCLEGTGSFGSVSVRNEPNIYLDPNMFAAVYFDGEKQSARVLEGQVPISHYYGYKVHGFFGAGNGMTHKNYGLPRFRNCAFSAKFPFAHIDLQDETMPADVAVEGFSPFIPGNIDASSLPAASVSYTFKNKTDKPLRGVFYFSAIQFSEMRFMNLPDGDEYAFVRPLKNGFVLEQREFGQKKSTYGAFSITTNDENAAVNTNLYRGGWWDTLTMRWNEIAEGRVKNESAEDMKSPGGAVEIPFEVAAKGEKTLTVHMNWYVPYTDLCEGKDAVEGVAELRHQPWYAGKYNSIEETAADYNARYEELKKETLKFTYAFYETNIPEEIVEAVTANLVILKSPTVLRQRDGRMWAWEGCADTFGSCAGSCNHVWNYAQAICHLFPNMERSLRETEFNEDMNKAGHQNFRSSLPIHENSHNFYAASDGQPGGIMKMYREWRICGNTEWLRSYWDKMVLSMEYCIRTWDPDEQGVLTEPHHNTYDIEFWGADGMCSSFYIGALKAMAVMGKELGLDAGRYEKLYEKGRKYLETILWNGEYFYQKPEWKNLKAKFDDHNDPVLMAEGPKYQYGTGCISDGVLGAWLAKQCGLGDILDPEKIKKHLLSVYKYNYKTSLLDHANPQRPGYAVGDEGGVLLCTWPRGEKPSIPFVYSDEVWTGIEYHVAAHLMSFGYMKEGLDIVRTLRNRYDGERRNPFDEYECGHWYGRALSSYGMLEAATGVRYDAVSRTLYANRGHYKVFLAAETGYGVVEALGEAVHLSVKNGEIPVENVVLL